MDNTHPSTPRADGPNFLIIGAMKCATSTIHDQLAHQRGISMSAPKEPNFFSDEENWTKGIGWYEAMFLSMPPNDLKGESSTHYTKRPTYPETARRMHELVPSAKLVYVMRDPVERIVSQYIHEWSQRVIDDGCPIDEAIHAHPMLLDYSRYAMQLAPFFELFGPEAILPVFFERYRQDPKRELGRIARHIGFEGDITIADDGRKNVSSERQRRSPLLSKVLDVRLVQIARRSLLPPAIREKIRSRWTLKDRPRLSEESLRFVRSELDPDLKILGEKLGIELDCIHFKERVVQTGSLEWTGRGGDS